ncbi:MAG TPA: ATP-binding protein [Polyangiaceae bacterium]|jgi:signal transduction histidine kinase/CheY-like chemotaxis protein
MAARESGDGQAQEMAALQARVQELEEALRAIRAREDERKRAESVLLEAKRELEDSNQAKSEFLARMSHELRTPLNSILGFSQVLNTDPDEPLTGSQKESVRQILKAGWHLLALINEVLDLARIESGKLPISIESVGVEQIVREAMTLIAPVAEKHQVKVFDETKGFRQLFVMADRTRLKQVLLNLLSNGVKYNRPGGTVTLTCTRPRDGRLVLSVQDSGPGIPREEQSQLFTPFTRLNARAEVEGAGMGLAITKRLVELMGGSIGVESEPGKGSRFFFELNIGLKPAMEMEETDPSMIIVRRGATEVTLLHIEDNPANRALVSRILERRPHIKILAAETAEKGIEMARTRDPDLIVLDINLPGIDGFEALARLRSFSDTRNIPVIALSANAMPSEVKRGLEAGFLQYLTKPVDVKEFLRTIDVFLKGHVPKSTPPPTSSPMQ